MIPLGLHHVVSMLKLIGTACDSGPECMSLTLDACIACLHSQVLSPCLAARARTFGSKLDLKDEWVPVDNTYFDATGGCRRADENCFPLRCQSVSYVVLMIIRELSTLKFPCCSNRCLEMYGLMSGVAFLHRRH